MKTVLLALVATAACSQTVSVPDEGPAVYVVRIISAEAAHRGAFVACLAQNDLPFWRESKIKRALKTVSVFETTTVLRSEPGVPAWNFVISTQLAQGGDADLLVRAIQERKNCEAAPGVELRRMETLITTPNSNYAKATAADDLKARESKGEYGIEYIKVNDTPEDLRRYREIMSSNIGPAVGVRVRDELSLGFLATETVKVHFIQPDMPRWNQIHIALPNPQKGALTPGKGATAELGLDSLRTRPRIDRARQLFDLAVR